MPFRDKIVHLNAVSRPQTESAHTKTQTFVQATNKTNCSLTAAEPETTATPTHQHRGGKSENKSPATIQKLDTTPYHNPWQTFQSTTFKRTTGEGWEAIEAYTTDRKVNITKKEHTHNVATESSNTAIITKKNAIFIQPLASIQQRRTMSTKANSMMD